MSTGELTPREREYLDCKTPMLPPSTAAARVVMGVFASLLQAAFMPGADKADRGLFRTAREIKYTKYKKAVLRKLSGTPKKNDAKLLKKLNGKDFVLAEDVRDADEYTRQMYEEYMKKREQKTENSK